MENKIKVVLAKQYDLVVGDTFQLFYRGVIQAPNPYVYSIVAVCEKGKSFPRYFEYTPQDVGQHTLTVSVYDSDHNVLGSATTTLNVVKPKRPKNSINVLCIGDSLTAEGVWVEELHGRISSSEGEPQGLGFSNVNFVGNCKRGDVGYVAFGGWTWERFMSDKPGAIWIEAPNNKTEKDQHSLWQDENGAIWQIETLQVDYLKLNRYEDHTSPRPQSGVLTHYKNAVDTNPIKFYSSSDEKPSPFFDPQKRCIDFKTYIQRLGIDKIDVVYILLGGNGRMRPVAINNTNEAYCKIVVEEAKVLVDKIKADLPNVKVKVMMSQLPSSKGGIGSNYGAHPLLTDYYKSVMYHLECNLAYQNWVLQDGYKDFMEFINVTGQFDSEYGYPHIEKPVNVRCKTTEWLDTNAVHPTKEGQMQIADAVYRNLVKEISK
ncbi:MAG: hypothetical protein IJX16_01440 [Clostridia bacterium]|nr:hypothetical protein [Clostridia bacterium]